ncbi:hypothetical protein ACFL52_02450 [Candidatus Margulisiibacteriota bacterium]
MIRRADPVSTRAYQKSNSYRCGLELRKQIKDNPKDMDVRKKLFESRFGDFDTGFNEFVASTQKGSGAKFYKSVLFNLLFAEVEAIYKVVPECHRYPPLRLESEVADKLKYYKQILIEMIMEKPFRYCYLNFVLEKAKTRNEFIRWMKELEGIDEGIRNKVGLKYDYEVLFINIENGGYYINTITKAIGERSIDELKSERTAVVDQAFVEISKIITRTKPSQSWLVGSR